MDDSSNSYPALRSPFDDAFSPPLPLKGSFVKFHRAVSKAGVTFRLHFLSWWFQPSQALLCRLLAQRSPATAPSSVTFDVPGTQSSTFAHSA